MIKVGLQPFNARGPGECGSAFSAMAKSRIDAIVIFQDGIFNANLTLIAGLATKHRLPSSGIKEFAEVGGLIGYGANLGEMFRRAAYFVDKIIRGVKPSDIPVEQPTKFEMVVNMKTAKALGVRIPDSILVQATRVIE